MKLYIFLGLIILTTSSFGQRLSVGLHLGTGGTTYESIFYGDTLTANDKSQDYFLRDTLNGSNSARLLPNISLNLEFKHFFFSIKPIYSFSDKRFYLLPIEANTLDTTKIEVRQHFINLPFSIGYKFFNKHL